jgi:hypothetical protein
MMRDERQRCIVCHIQRCSSGNLCEPCYQSMHKDHGAMNGGAYGLITWAANRAWSFAEKESKELNE